MHFDSPHPRLLSGTTMTNSLRTSKAKTHTAQAHAREPEPDDGGSASEPLCVILETETKVKPESQTDGPNLAEQFVEVWTEWPVGPRAAAWREFQSASRETGFDVDIVLAHMLEPTVRKAVLAEKSSNPTWLLRYLKERRWRTDPVLGPAPTLSRAARPQPATSTISVEVIEPPTEAQLAENRQRIAAEMAKLRKITGAKAQGDPERKPDVPKVSETIDDKIPQRAPPGP
jgi:hypothetical protein